MKKTTVILALALGLSFGYTHANNDLNPSNSIEVISSPSISPFCTSVAKGDIVTVKKLIELGVDVNEKSNGMTPAMYAARYNRVEILELLIKEGANLKSRSKKGHTALKYAEMSNAKEAQVLIKNTLKKK
ncbi:ankyrin repeat domain-containing protein [Mangrovimonas cancribranchiae]|uniref:Ankyrin repeat domain-containing protein n=1 Tax=Mangrovimonas cancribranchiae TaxID=3080055 RepID=A0AAU6P7V0_9FLAO